MAYMPSKDSDQPGHPFSLIRVFPVCMKKAWALSYPVSTQQRLIRLGRCPGWSESLLGAVILLILSWDVSVLIVNCKSLHLLAAATGFLLSKLTVILAPSWENLFLPYANNKGADQPANPHSLISAIVVCCLDSIIPLLAIAKLSRP